MILIQYIYEIYVYKIYVYYFIFTFLELLYNYNLSTDSKSYINCSILTNMIFSDSKTSFLFLTYTLTEN